MKKTISCILALLMLAMLAACGTSDASASGAATASDGSKTKITVLRPGDQEPVAAFMEPAIEQFMVDNPDIEVEIVYEAWGGWLQTYPTMFENDTQPDVIFWWDNKQLDSSAAGRLQPLDDVVDQEVFDKLPQSYWDLADIGTSKTYYIPSSVDPLLLYYNKDVFEAAGLDPDSPPTTWSELLAACKAINDNTDVPALGVPAKAGMDTLQEFVALFMTQKTGTDLLDQNNEVAFNNDEGLEALEYLTELFQYAMPSTTDYGRGDLRPLVRDGQVGIVLDGPWAVKTYIEAYGDNLDESPIMIAAAPQPDDATENITWAGSNGWVATRAETLEASGRLISWLMSDEMLYGHHKAYGSIPVTQYELDQEYYQYDYWQRMYDILGEYKLIGMIGKYSTNPSGYYTDLEAVEQLLLLGEIDAQQAMAAMVESVENINARQS